MYAFNIKNKNQKEDSGKVFKFSKSISVLLKKMWYRDFNNCTVIYTFHYKLLKFNNIKTFLSCFISAQGEYEVSLWVVFYCRFSSIDSKADSTLTYTTKHLNIINILIDPPVLWDYMQCNRLQSAYYESLCLNSYDYTVYYTQYIKTLA